MICITTLRTDFLHNLFPTTNFNCYDLSHSALLLLLVFFSSADTTSSPSAMLQHSVYSIQQPAFSHQSPVFIVRPATGTTNEIVNFC